MTKLSITIITLFISMQAICAQATTVVGTETANDSSLALSNDSLTAIANEATLYDQTVQEDSSSRRNIFQKIQDSGLGEFARKIHWGVMGGVGPATLHFEKKDIYQHYVCNVRVGIIADRDLKAINENLFVESGLEFQRKGYQKFFNQHADSLHTDYKEKTNLYYLTLPMTASYRLHFRGFEFTPMVGIYHALAIGGRFKYIRKNNDRGEYTETQKRYPMFGDKKGTERLFDTRRYDIGLRLAVGIEYFKGMRSSLGYDLGFIDVIKNDFRGDKYKSKNGVFYISHTYFFK